MIASIEELDFGQSDSLDPQFEEPDVCSVHEDIYNHNPELYQTVSSRFLVNPNDDSNSSIAKRFISKAHASINLGRHSPGPASYNQDFDTIHGNGTWPHKSAPPRGISFARSDRSSQFTNARFISKDLTKTAMGRDSPGPKYKPGSFVGRDGPHVSFTTAKQQSDVGFAATVPGPKYDTYDALGKQALSSKLSEPGIVFNKTERFSESKQDAKAVVPGPGTHMPEIEVVKPSPVAYSFGSAPRAVSVTAVCNSEKKRFISRKHSETEAGIDSPGPKYNTSHAHRFVRKGAPAFSFGPREQPNESPQIKRRPKSTPPFISLIQLNDSFADKTRSPANSIVPGNSMSSSTSLDQAQNATRSNSRKSGIEQQLQGMDSPGPCAYSPEKPKKHEPSASFGTSPDKDKLRFFGNELVSRAETNESPGPKYYPTDISAPRTATPLLYCHERGLASETKEPFEVPGPAKYNISPSPIGITAPKPLIVGREAEISISDVSLTRVHIRYISKEMSRENLGAFSPGPKYFPEVDPIGSGPKISFGQPHAEETHGSDGAADLPPSDVRYYGPGISQGTGSLSPGPAAHVFVDDKHLINKRSPAYSIPKARKEPSRRYRKHKKETGELFFPPRVIAISREHVKKENLGHFSPGPAAYVPDAKNESRRKQTPACKFGTEKRTWMTVKDTPGPIYTPHYQAVRAQAPGISFGGLA